ncbi:MAG: hypothetical protein B6I38_10220 [Anaerolineaceae bacterium 4572_5.1]|nr:MAG: hypothetical protein B6I38_10220 [Anaerolineaceae bacterium 4572_5.1]RLD05079.1 MAG: hypothetical protein DRI56_10190 [Chloroflexota bacterium]
MNNNRYVFRILIGIVLCLSALNSTGCNFLGNNASDNTSQTPNISVLSVKFHWPQALELAQKWHSDAYLIDVTVDVLLPHVPSSRAEVGFVFRSPSDEKATLGVICHNACYTEKFNSSLSLPQCTPFSIDDIALDSKDALEIGLADGRDTYVDVQNASLQLKLERNYPRCDGSMITWNIRFSNIVTFEGIDIVIDALTGDVTEIRD